MQYPDFFLSNAPRRIPALLLFLSAAPLAGALISQYAFGLLPCVLCIYQRVPYAVIIGLALLGFAFARTSRCVGPLVLLSMLAFLTDAGIAFFHVGVEQGWWHGTEACGGSDVVASSIEELRRQIMEAPAVRCDEPAFVFLGLSMAAWNMLYALAVAGVCGVLFGKLHAAAASEERKAP